MVQLLLVPPPTMIFIKVSGGVAPEIIVPFMGKEKDFILSWNRNTYLTLRMMLIWENFFLMIIK